MMLVSTLQYRMMDNPRKSCNFVGMKMKLENYIREDKEFRQVLLNQKAGILKYWAEHPDSDFDTDLFDSYENEIVKTYLQANNQNRTIRSLPVDKIKEKSLDWYHQSKGSELRFLVAMKSELIARSEELYEQVFNYIEIYMTDAYKESRRRKYPEGISPQGFYKEVIEKYGPLGLSLDCLEKVLQEYRGKAVHITAKHFFLANIVHSGKSHKWEEVNNLQKDFDIRMFIDSYHADGGYRKLRQAVKEMINNSTKNLTEEESRTVCRNMAKDEIRKVNQFTRWVNNETYPMEETEEGKLIPLISPEERHWLHNIMYENSPAATGAQRLTTMDRYFCYFISILENIGKIWAAQLLVHGIDMKELEKETGVILSRNPAFLYYVDRFVDDQRGDCCVYDYAEAKNLLAKVRRTICLKDITWEEEKQCFKNAVLYVMDLKRKKDGNYLFDKNTLWIAVYRFAIDIGIMYDKGDPNEPQDKTAPQYAFFEKFAHELQLDADPPTRHPFKVSSIDSLNKDSYKRYRQPHPWSMDGLKEPSKGFTLYKELNAVYIALSKIFFISMNKLP